MKTLWLLFSLLGVFGAALIWLGVRTVTQNQRIASLESQLASAHTQAVKSTVETVPPAPVPPSAAPSSPAPEDTRPAPQLLGPANNPWSARLQESQAALGRVQSRVDELEAKLQEMTNDRVRLSGAESEARAQIAEMKGRVEELVGERPSWEKRIRDLEVENTRLRDQSAAAAQRAGQMGRLATEWQDLAQRQQTYLTNAVRRFRELTDLFRQMPGLVEMKGNGPELARIQTVISMADEDFRQLSDLQVRLGRVQKQIATLK